MYLEAACRGEEGQQTVSQLTRIPTANFFSTALDILSSFAISFCSCCCSFPSSLGFGFFARVLNHDLHCFLVFLC